MERNLIGEMNMMKESGAKPNFTDLARRYGVDRHTVARYWNGGGPQPPDGREGRASGFDRYRTEIDGKAALPGMTKKALHELLLERHAGDEWIGNTYLDGFDRISPAFLNSTGLM